MKIPKTDIFQRKYKRGIFLNLKKTRGKGG